MGAWTEKRVKTGGSDSLMPHTFSSLVEERRDKTEFTFQDDPFTPLNSRWAIFIFIYFFKEREKKGGL